jgi:DNA primase
MISQDTIDRVFEAAEVLKVVGRFVELKQAGANWKGLSPFVQEKTPSFMVSPSKNIYKCFSSGKGGTPLNFLMEYKSLTYPEAIAALAEMYGIEVVHDTKKEDAPQRDHLAELHKVLNGTQTYYQKNLWALEHDAPALDELFNRRKLSKDAVIQWQLGWAPDEWRFLTDKLLPKGFFEVARELGLVAHKNGNNYDVLRGRITFPIHDHQDRLIGMAGRSLHGEPKYLNSPDTKLYKKDRVLYGLNHAAKAIREAGFAYVTEGYFDVISMHNAGIENTVASCGTALTEGHFKLLARYCKHIVLLYDGDKAGRAATEKAVLAAASHQMKVDVVNLPDGIDPDDLARQYAPAFELETETI